MSKLLKYFLIGFVAIAAIVLACTVYSCSLDDDTDSDKDKDDEIGEFYDENVDSNGWI